MNLKLAVKNNGRGRVISWIGLGEWFDKDEEREVDFTRLPNILETMVHCRLDSMDAEIKSGDVSVAVVTDLAVRVPQIIVDKSPEVKPVVTVKVADLKAEAPKVDDRKIPGDDKSADRQGAFSEGPMEGFFPKATQFVNQVSEDMVGAIKSMSDIPKVEVFADKSAGVPVLPKSEPMFTPKVEAAKEEAPKVVELKQPVRRGRPPKA